MELYACLAALFKTLEQFPNQAALLRRAVLDLSKNKAGPVEIKGLLDRWGEIPTEILAQHGDAFLDILDMSYKNSSTTAAINHSEIIYTLGYLSRLSHFSLWKQFFSQAKIFFSRRDAHAGAFLELRHSLEYFESDLSRESLIRMILGVADFPGAFSYGQMDSKAWLMREAVRLWGKDWGRIFILAGWVGVLARFIFEHEINATAVRSFDIDAAACAGAEVLNQNEVQKDWLFKSSATDVCNLPYPARFMVQRKDGSTCQLTEMPDVVINTSCEHIADLDSWWAPIPSGMRVILQSNDGFGIEGHVACVRSLAEFLGTMKLAEVEYAGEKKLPEFTRFMLIGRK